MTRRRRKSLPPIPPGVDPKLRAWMEAAKEQLEVGQGVRGQVADQNVTVGDLVDSGIASYRKGAANAGAGQSLIPASQVPDRSNPPRPENVQVSAAIGVNIIIWSEPNRQYRNHSYAVILRGEGNDALPGDAVVIGSANGSIYSDYTVVGGTIYRYWVRFVSRADIQGPIHSSEGTPIETSRKGRDILNELNQELAGEPDTLGSPDETFIIHADRFAVRQTVEGDPVLPFIIKDGVIYLRTAVIEEGSIDQGQIGPISFGKIVDEETGEPITTFAGKLKGNAIDVETLEVYNANIKGDLSSKGANPYIAGVQGWFIGQDGFAEFNNAQIRGNVDLDSLTVNGELPQAGFALDGGTFSNNRAMGGTSFSETIIRDDETSFANVPGGARLSYSHIGSLSASVQGRSGGQIFELMHSSNDIRSWPLPHPDSFYNRIEEFDVWGRRGYYYSTRNWGYTTDIDPTRYRANITLRFRIWINGSLEVDESQVQNLDFTLQASWSGSSHTHGAISHQNSTQNVNLNIPLSTGLQYIFPNFVASANVKVEASIICSNVRCTGEQPASANRRFIRSISQAGLSGDLSRLG